MLRYILLLLFIITPTFAEADGLTFADQIPEDALNPQAGQFLTLTVENDTFGSGADQHYTSGVRVTYFDINDEPMMLSRTMAEWFPLFDKGAMRTTYYAAGQNIYTPDDITLRNPNPNDRPYAGFLYGTIGLGSLSANHLDTMELTLGIVGPWALGEEAQSEVHRLLNGTDPKGWDTQLDNEPAVILTWERRWPGFASFHFDEAALRLTPHGGVSLGNVYTHANAGFAVQLLPSQFQWQSLPARVPPSVPGSGYFYVPEGNFAWSLFAGVDGRAIGRNIFLDGNTFTDSRSIDRRDFVLDASLGASLTYGKTQLSYSLNWRSREFDAQSNGDIFGAISIGRRF